MSKAKWELWHQAEVACPECEGIIYEDIGYDADLAQFKHDFIGGKRIVVCTNEDCGTEFELEKP